MGTSSDNRRIEPPESALDPQQLATADSEVMRQLVTQADVLEDLIGDLLLLFATESSLEAIQRLHDAAADVAAHARAGVLIPPAPGLSPAEYWNRRERILSEVREKAEYCVHGPPKPEPHLRLACVGGTCVQGG